MISDGWLTKAETARRLGISERGLERLVAKGEGPAVRYRPRTGNRPEPLYRERDVDNMAPHTRTEVMRPGDPRLPRPEVPAVATVPTYDLRPLASAFEALAGAILTRFPTPPPTVKQWLTPGEAGAYLGLSEGLIRRLIRAGRLPFARDGHFYKVSRASCDSIDVVTQLSELKQTTQALRAAVAGRKNGQ